MRWRELVEAPISDIELIPPETGMDFDAGTSFDSTDRKLLQSEKGRAKIIRAFSKTPHMFEVFFFNNLDIEGGSVSDNENVDVRATENNAGVHKSFGDIEGKPGVIRVVLISNLSPLEAKMPITAWTLAHKIGHSLQDQVTRTQQRGSSSKWVKKIDALIYNIVQTDIGKSTLLLKDGGGFSYPTTALMNMLTMKSAETNSNSFEMFAEIIAQYLITGSVKMNLRKQTTQPLIDHLNQEIKAMFDSLDGKVLVEV